MGLPGKRLILLIFIARFSYGRACRWNRPAQWQERKLKENLADAKAAELYAKREVS